VIAGDFAVFKNKRKKRNGLWQQLFYDFKYKLCTPEDSKEPEIIFFRFSTLNSPKIPSLKSQQCILSAVENSKDRPQNLSFSTFYPPSLHLETWKFVQKYLRVRPRARVNFRLCPLTLRIARTHKPFLVCELLPSLWSVADQCQVIYIKVYSGPPPSSKVHICSKPQVSTWSRSGKIPDRKWTFESFFPRFDFVYKKPKDKALRWGPCMKCMCVRYQCISKVKGLDMHIKCVQI